MEDSDKIQLTDPAIYPDETVLHSLLGESYATYCELLDLLHENDMTADWIYYKDAKAWLCKIQKKKRTIIWMAARKGFLQATIYFPEKYLNAIYDLPISNQTKEKLQNFRMVGKSKPCMFELDHQGIPTDFKTVMEFKIVSK